MKSPLYLLFILFIASAGCKKDVLHWQKVQRIETHTTSSLYRIKFVTDKTCIIGGGEKFNKAEILHSSDGGNTFSLRSFPQAGKAMCGLGTTPSSHIYLCGVDGRVLLSKDLGQSFIAAQIPDWRNYVGNDFATDNDGFFIATITQQQGTIVHVDANLQIQDTTYYGFGLNDIVFTDQHTGYIAGYGVILKTTNRGKTWNYLDIKNDNFNAMDCQGNNEVWACGYAGSIIHTTDGGNTWEILRNGNDLTLPRYKLQDIAYQDKLHIWAVGEEGLVIYTDDGGKHWMEYERFTDVTLRSIALTPQDNLLVCGDEGVLYKLETK